MEKMNVVSTLIREYGERIYEDLDLDEMMDDLDSEDSIMKIVREHYSNVV